MLILLSWACGPGESAFPDGGGDAFTEGCERAGYEPVTDTSTAMEGFSFSVDELAAAALGDWSGELQVIAEGESERVALSFGEPAVVQAWYYSDGSADGGDCAPAYMLELAITVDAGERLDEETWNAVQIVAGSTDEVSVEASLDAGGLSGTAAPDGFEVEDYEQVWLVLSMDFSEAAWEGELAFRGEDPDSEGDTGSGEDTGSKEDTGSEEDTGSKDTGSVEDTGVKELAGGSVSEAWGTFSLER